jgi:hypothetical protein
MNLGFPRMPGKINYEKSVINFSNVQSKSIG